MSTYWTETKHPLTGQWENATWCDDLFGRHRYGVLFPSDTEHLKLLEGTDAWGEAARKVAFSPEMVKLEIREPSDDFALGKPSTETPNVCESCQ